MKSKLKVNKKGGKKCVKWSERKCDKADSFSLPSMGTRGRLWPKLAIMALSSGKLICSYGQDSPWSDCCCGLFVCLLTHCMLGNFSCFWWRLLTYFKINFFKKLFYEYFLSVKQLDPDQDRHSVGPDLGPNCLQIVSAHGKSRRKQGKRAGESVCTNRVYLFASSVRNHFAI